MEIVALVVLVVFLVSVAAGTWESYDAPRPTAAELAADRCATCNREQEWYDSLPWWKKAAYVGWWLARGAVCLAKGC